MFKPLLKLKPSHILFEGNIARATDYNTYAAIVGPWYAAQPISIPTASLKIALAAGGKIAQWVGMVCNGIALVGDPEGSPAWYADPSAGETWGAVHGNYAPALVAMSAKDVRYYLNGLMVSRADGVAVATNGHRLHVVPLEAMPLFDAPDVIVPRTLFDAAPKEAILSLGQTHARMDWAGGYSVQKYIDGNFPDYRRVTPSLDSRPIVATFNAASLANLERALKVKKASTSGRFYAASCNSRGEIFTPELPNALQCFDGCDVLPEVSFQINYLIDAVKACGGAGSAYFGNTIDESLLLRAVNGRVECVVMPTRI